MSWVALGLSAIFGINVFLSYFDSKSKIKFNYNSFLLLRTKKLTQIIFKLKNE